MKTNSSNSPSPEDISKFCNHAGKAFFISMPDSNRKFVIKEINSHARKLLGIENATAPIIPEEMLSLNSCTIDEYLSKSYVSHSPVESVCWAKGTSEPLIINSFKLENENLASIIDDIPEDLSVITGKPGNLDQFSDIISFSIIFTDQWRINYLSEQCRFITGYTKEELLESGRISWTDLINEEDRDNVRMARKNAIFKKHPYSIEYRITDKEGHTKYIWEKGAPVPDSQGAINKIDGFLHDITVKIKADLAMRSINEKNNRSIRLDALTRMAGGIAHEMNNQLMGISAIAGIISMKSSESDITESISKINDIIEKSASIINDLQRLSTEGDNEKKIMSAHTILDSAIEHFTSETLNRHRVEFSYGAPRHYLNADPEKIKEALCRILENSDEAMHKSGGSILISTENSKSAENTDIIEIKLKDTGRGIDEKYLARIFDPFFTTKTNGNSRGMGLSIALGIIESHGGSISCSNGKSGGLEVRLSLPVI